MLTACSHRHWLNVLLLLESERVPCQTRSLTLVVMLRPTLHSPPSTYPPTANHPYPHQRHHHLPRVAPQDVDGTYQSQLRFATRQMEKKFRCRYDTLKALYEDRLQSLSAQLAQIQQTVSQDDVLAQMGADGASAHFVPARREEMVFDLLHSEREQMIERLASDLAKTEAEAKQSFRESQVRECVCACMRACVHACSSSSSSSSSKG